MKAETLEKAQTLSKEIQELKSTIVTISWKSTRPDNTGRWKGFPWMIRFFNKENQDGTKEAKIYLFDSISNYGSDIPVDEGLLIVIKEYFKNKLSEKEKQFNELC